jgi:hypothetical protein
VKNSVFSLRVSLPDHQVFIRMVDGYPSHPYDKWLKLRAQEVDNYRSEGLEVVDIDVTPDELARHCRKTGARADLNTLRGLATMKGLGAFK